MIPKIIHYCWFGNNQKNEEILLCLESWKKHCPDFVIKEWNESNFNVSASPFTKRMYAEKKWAFVADYARLHTLLNEGGFYLDTDMLLCQSLSPLTPHECVLGEENDGIISAGMIAAVPNHKFIQECKKFYDTHTQETVTIPRVLTQVYAQFTDKKSIIVFPPNTFYPFDADHIKNYHGQQLSKDVYSVHLWHHSWGHPLNRFFKKIGIYRTGKKIVELLRIKQILKRLFGFI